MFEGQHERAANYIEESLAAARDRGDQGQLTRDLSGLGAAVLNLGDVSRARTLQVEALTVARRIGDRWGSAMTLTLLGHVELAAGDDEQARACLTEAAALFQSIGNLMYLPWCLEGLAGVAAARGHHECAAELDGARETVRAEFGMLLPPAHPAGYNATLGRVREALPPERYDAAFSAGRRRPADQTLKRALTTI
jgi:tetratricopeptide (TPR) repeat protein